MTKLENERGGRSPSQRLSTPTNVRVTSPNAGRRARDAELPPNGARCLPTPAVGALSTVECLPSASATDRHIGAICPETPAHALPLLLEATH